MAGAVCAGVGNESDVLACISWLIYPSIFRTLTYFETVVYSEPCQICTLFRTLRTLRKITNAKKKTIDL